jgi:hypothetical protein
MAGGDDTTKPRRHGMERFCMVKFVRSFYTYIHIFPTYVFPTFSKLECAAKANTGFLVTYRKKTDSEISIVGKNS